VATRPTTAASEKKRLRAAVRKPRPGPRLIGLTGTNGAGKGEAAVFFRKKGFAYFSLSDLIREELQKRKLAPTRDNLIRAGNELRRRHGADILARRILRRVKGRAVIDSIRHPKEVERLRTRPAFRLVAVDAPAALRFERVKRRGRQESAATLEEFLAKERKEMGRSPEAQQLDLCLRMADTTLVNDSSLEDFHRKLEALL
jgi:dephospho-CoA kinase